MQEGIKKVTDHICKICGERLMPDEIFLHRKMFGRTSKGIMCLDCQASYLRINRGCLEKVIAKYRKSDTLA